MSIIQICINDKVTLKKKHPCGCDNFTVKRLGSDIRIECNKCFKDLILPREKLEKAIKKIEREDITNDK